MTIAVHLEIALSCFLIGLNWLVGGVIILFYSIFFCGELGVVDRMTWQTHLAFASEKIIVEAGERL